MYAYNWKDNNDKKTLNICLSVVVVQKYIGTLTPAMGPPFALTVPLLSYYATNNRSFLPHLRVGEGVNGNAAALCNRAWVIEYSLIAWAYGL